MKGSSPAMPPMWQEMTQPPLCLVYKVVLRFVVQNFFIHDNSGNNIKSSESLILLFALFSDAVSGSHTHLTRAISW